jgi:hypothetical protein
MHFWRVQFVPTLSFPKFHRGLIALLLLAAAILMIAFSRPLWMGEVFVEDDLAAYHLPMFSFYQDAVRSGESFLWTPGILNGFYWHGEGQGGFTHPLYYLLSLLFPLHVVAVLHILLNYPFAFAGAWLFLRQRKLEPPAALFGALLFTFAGVMLNHYIHICLVAVLSHVFWQLYAIDRGMRSSRGGERVAMVFLVLALSVSQLLLGSPQFTYYSWLCEMLYVLHLVAATRNTRVMLALGAAKLMSFPVAAIQILPTIDGLRNSLRLDPDLEYQLVDSLHPLNLLQLLSPYMYHQRVFAMVHGDQPWDAPYMGAFATVAILLVVLNRNRLNAHRTLAFAAFGLLILGVVSSWGRYGFLYPVYDLIPVVNKFRAPARYMAVAHVSLTVVGAIAFGVLLQAVRARNPLPWRGLLPLIAIPLTSWIMAFSLTWAKSLQDPAEYSRFFLFLQSPAPLAIGAVLLSAATALAIAAGRGSRAALAGVVLLTLVDLGAYSLRHKPSQPLATYTAEIDVPEEAPPGARLDPDIHTFFMNRILVRGYRGVYGYVSMFPPRGLDYTQVLPLQLAGVTHRQARLLGTPDVHEAKLAGKSWIPLEGAFPRARLLTKVVASATPAEDIYKVDVATTGLLAEPMALPPGSPGSADVTTDRPGNIQVTTQAPTRQLLVVSENYHPGWRTTVNGEYVPTHEVYGDFIGCLVEPGECRVQFVFDPDSWRYGKRITALSLLACLPLCWVFRRTLGGHS